MNGKQVAKIMQTYDNGDALTDAQIKSLRDGLQFLYDFNNTFNIRPEAVYYGIQLRSVESCIEARNQDKA